MSTFCTSCGAANSGAGFCTSCGTPAATTSGPAPAPIATPVTETAWSSSEESVESGQLSLSPGNGLDVSKKKILVNAAVFVLIVGIGVGAFFAGKSSVDLEAERKTSYDIGFEAGDSAGYDRGDSAGYSRGNSAGYSQGLSEGKFEGCQWVFEQANDATAVTKYNIYGYGFSRYPGSVYVSKSNC